MTIAQIIQGRSPESIISCDVLTSVSDAIHMLAEQKIGALPVLRDGAIAGIFSERDVIYRVSEHGSSCLDMKVGDIMTSPAITVEPSTSVEDALAMMTRRRFRHFPVVEDGKLLAFVSIGDLVKTKIDEVEHEAEALRSYIQTA